jgi:hypothetical protein
MRPLRIAMAAVALLALVAAATYVAGEQVEVVVLHTFDAEGAAHATKMWVVDHDGRPWVRVANPRRAWYQRLLAKPEVELLRGGRAFPLRATPDPSPETRRAIDAAFAARYGLTDAWYGILVRRDPIPVRLDPR